MDRIYIKILCKAAADYYSNTLRITHKLIGLIDRNFNVNVFVLKLQPQGKNRFFNLFYEYFRLAPILSFYS